MSEKFRISLWEDGVENDVFFEDCWEEVEAVKKDLENIYQQVLS